MHKVKNRYIIHILRVFFKYTYTYYICIYNIVHVKERRGIQLINIIHDILQCRVQPKIFGQTHYFENSR